MELNINNDNSTDNTLEVLRPWIDKGIVELWSGYGQIEFYKLISEMKKDETEWIAFFDIDEFYQGDKTLREFLRELDGETVALE